MSGATSLLPVRASRSAALVRASALASRLARATGDRPVLYGVLATTALTLSSFLFADLPHSSWPGTVGWLAHLRTLPGTGGLAISVAVLAMGLLATTWLSVGRRVLRDGADPRTLVRYAAAWSAPLLLAAPLFSNDAWSYAAQGVVAASGLDPYSFGPGVLSGAINEAVTPVWMWTPAPYGPVAVVAGEVVARLTTDPFLLVVWMRLVAIAGLALLALAVPRLARWSRVDPAIAMWLVVANPAVLAHFVGGAHNDALMVGVVALGVAAAVAGHWRRAALVVGLAAAIKVPGILALVAVLGLTVTVRTSLRERIRRGAVMAALALGVLFASGVVTSLGAGWISALKVPTLVEPALSISTQLGRLGGWLLDVGGFPGAESGVTVGRALGVLAAALIVLVLALRTGPDTAIRDAGIALLAIVVLGPVVYPWYLLWSLPFLATQRLGRGVLTAIVAASTILAVSAPLHETTIDALTTTAGLVVLVLLVAAATTSRLLHLVPDSALLHEPPSWDDERDELVERGSGPREAALSGSRR